MEMAMPLDFEIMSQLRQLGSTGERNRADFFHMLGWYNLNVWSSPVALRTNKFPLFSFSKYWRNQKMTGSWAAPLPIIKKLFKGASTHSWPKIFIFFSS